MKPQNHPELMSCNDDLEIDIFCESQSERQNRPKKIMTRSTKKYKLRKQVRTLLWIYLVPIAIVSLLLCCSGFRVITGLAHHTATLMARHPLFCYSLFIGSAIIFLASGISIFLFLRKRDRWVDWAIGIGIALVLFFVSSKLL